MKRSFSDVKCTNKMYIRHWIFVLVYKHRDAIRCIFDIKMKLKKQCQVLRGSVVLCMKAFKEINQKARGVWMKGKQDGWLLIMPT